LSAVAAAAKPHVADCCSAELANPTEKTGATHRDAAQADAARRPSLKARDLPDADTARLRVIRRGVAELHSPVEPQKMCGPLAADPHAGALIGRAGLHSAMIVPIAAQGRTLGAIVFAASTAERS